MIKKVSKIIICVISVFIIGGFDVNASSGALLKDSIRTCPNGKYYGQHGSDKHSGMKLKDLAYQVDGLQ